MGVETKFQIRYVNGKDIIYFSDKKQFIESIQGSVDDEFNREIIKVGTIFKSLGFEYKVNSIEIEFDYLLDGEGNRKDIDLNENFSKSEITVVIFVE